MVSVWYVFFKFESQLWLPARYLSTYEGQKKYILDEYPTRCARRSKTLGFMKFKLQLRVSAMLRIFPRKPRDNRKCFFFVVFSISSLSVMHQSFETPRCRSLDRWFIQLRLYTEFERAIVELDLLALNSSSQRSWQRL